MLSMTGFGDAQHQSGHADRARGSSLGQQPTPEDLLPLARGLRGVGAPTGRGGPRLRSPRLAAAQPADRTGGRVTRTTRSTPSLLVHYHRQISALSAKLHDIGEIHLTDLLQLPGVIREAKQADADTQAEWPLVEDDAAPGPRTAQSNASSRRLGLGRRPAGELRVDWPRVGPDRGAGTGDRPGLRGPPAGADQSVAGRAQSAGGPCDR